MIKILEPTLVLTFFGKDLEEGHKTEQTIFKNEIEANSIVLNYQLLNELKSSSNQANLKIVKKTPCIEDIIATEGDIKAVLKDGQIVLFTGYLSTNFSWSVTDWGECVLSLTIEDVGTRLLGKQFIKTGYHLFNCSATDAILAVCKAAGVNVSSQNPIISEKLTATVDSSKTCQEILEQIVYELGYVYYFDSLGFLSLFKIDCSSTSATRTLDGFSLFSSGGKVVTLSKKLRQYKSARVTYKGLGYAKKYLVYRNTTGKDSSHPYCNMELPSFSYFDGTEKYSQEQWTTATLDSFREPALIEACNAEGEPTVGSNKIIAISNVVQIFNSQSLKISCEITAAGGPYLKIEVHNAGNLDYYVTRCDASADIIYEKETCIVRTGTLAQEMEESDSLIKEELVYVHSKEKAQEHANLLGQYHRFCNTQYTFSSELDFELGSIVRVNENVFSQLDVIVMLVAKNCSHKTGIVQYQAIGISPFDLKADVYHQNINQGKDKITGLDGSSFTLQILSSNGSSFRSGMVATTLSCRVFLNLADVTNALESWRFSWKRKTNNSQVDLDWNACEKAIGHKIIDITSADCVGRTVFDCEVDFENLAL